MDIEEYVKDALATNQKIPTLEKLKFDQAPKIVKTKEVNKLKTLKFIKEQELKRLKDYSNRLQNQIETEIPCDSVDLTRISKQVESSAYKLVCELMETDTLEHILNRDRMSFLFKTKPCETLQSNLKIMKNSIKNIKK
jgi:hypothetical protein